MANNPITITVNSNIRIRPIFSLVPTPPPVTPPPIVTLTPPPTVPTTPPPTRPPVTPPPVQPNPSVTPSVTRTPAQSQTPIVSVTPSVTKTPVPSVTPSVTKTPAASQTPGASRTPDASVTPSTTPQASVTPTVSQIYWRSCIDGNLRPGTPPSDYVNRLYPKGGTCWEPGGQLGFEPSLAEALSYEWRRGSLVMPESRTVKATNPSYAATYAVSITSDPDITITPKAFTIGPRESTNFTVSVTQPLLNRLADGTTELILNVQLQEL